MYQLLVNDSNGLAFDYERYFFNRQEFLQLNSHKYFSYYLHNQKKNTIVGEIHFVPEGTIALSPYKASFGSFQLQAGLKAEAILFFIKSVEFDLRNHNINKIYIRSYPFSYDPSNASIIATSVVQEGFKVTLYDNNFHIPVTDHSTFYKSLKESEQNRINAAINNGFQVFQNPDPDIERVYNILLECRRDKGYPFRITYHDFKNMFIKLPEYYQVFEVYKDGKIIAVAVNIKISSKILYNFHLGQLPEFKKYSPAVLLLKEIYSYAVQHNYQQFDLGIATHDGIFNFPLANFKQNMGAVSSLKLVFEKNYYE